MIWGENGGGGYSTFFLFPAIEQANLRRLLVTHQVTLLQLEVGELWSITQTAILSKAFKKPILFDENWQKFASCQLIWKPWSSLPWGFHLLGISTSSDQHLHRSMYRFNGSDGRLRRTCETVPIVGEEGEEGGSKWTTPIKIPKIPCWNMIPVGHDWFEWKNDGCLIWILGLKKNSEAPRYCLKMRGPLVTLNKKGWAKR